MDIYEYLDADGPLIVLRHARAHAHDLALGQGRKRTVDQGHGHAVGGVVTVLVGQGQEVDLNQGKGHVLQGLHLVQGHVLGVEGELVLLIFEIISLSVLQSPW